VVLESRKWRLILQGLVVLITSLLILGYSGLASYALQDDTPHAINGARRLAKDQLNGRFTVLRAQADLDHSVALHRDGHTSYWVPIRGYTDKEGAIKLFVITDDINFASGNTEVAFTGRLVPFDQAPYAGDAEKVLNAALNDPVAPDTYVLLEGEAPKTYRPMVPLVGGLGLVWFVTAVSFTRSWRRAPRRR